MNHVLLDQLAGVMYSLAYRLRCKHYFCHLDTWKVCKECGEGGVGGYSPGQCILHDSTTTTCSNTHITYITVNVPDPNVQNNTVIVS